MPLIHTDKGVDLGASFEALEKRIEALEGHPALTKAELVAAIEEPEHEDKDSQSGHEG